MTRPSTIFRERLSPEPATRFCFVEPPFDFNAAEVSRYPAEVTGFRLLESMRKRFGWASFETRSVLDFGCGVRFARTILNLDLPFGLYFGVDVHAEAIAWLQANIADPRLRFARLDARNAYYNRDGGEQADDALTALGAPACDAASMFSVITHHNPQEAALALRQVRRAVKAEGRLYFTAFADESAAPFFEARPELPGNQSVHHPDDLAALVERAGWRIDAVYAPGDGLQQTAFVCTAV